MMTKTWPYGTTKKCTVHSVIRQRNLAAIIVNAGGRPVEGWVLVVKNEEPLPKSGDRGRIVFTQGGPTGGYWRYEPQEAKP